MLLTKETGDSAAFDVSNVAMQHICIHSKDKGQEMVIVIQRHDSCFEQPVRPVPVVQMRRDTVWSFFSDLHEICEARMFTCWVCKPELTTVYHLSVGRHDTKANPCLLLRMLWWQRRQHVQVSAWCCQSDTACACLTFSPAWCLMPHRHGGLTSLRGSIIGWLK